MANILKNNFPGTLQPILYQINWTDFWGQIKPTYIYKTVKNFYLFSPIIPFANVCTKKKKYQRARSCF
jgi:hypothetical protein